jgi:hypothetical protein
VSGHSPVLYLRGTLADHDHVRVLGAPLHRAVATGRATRSQAAGELTTQLTTALNEEGLVKEL